ncbi:MAG: hypothetical protein KDA93_11215 [Planctomycetaceae bacterium]|nr:hypothetical protein [Planctomycetaceae bacterium]
MKIIGLGTTVVDLLVVIEAYPVVDTKQPVLHSLIQVGGPVPTALTQLVRFGWSCELISAWGDDALGDVIEADLTRTGISFVSDCRMPQTSTGFSQVWIEHDTGTRTSVTQRAEMEGHLSSVRLLELLEGCDVLHLDAWPTREALIAAQTVKAAGGLVCLDTGSPKPGVEQLLSLADVVNAPRRFIQEFLLEANPERGAESLLSYGPSVVTVTDGDQGAWLCSEGRTIHRPAITGEPIVDTNGAGDVFTAGIIHACLSGSPPDVMLDFAVTTAGLKCRSLGNRDALPDLDTVRTALDLPEFPKKTAPGLQS